MKRGWMWVALLLSLGVNVGVLATLGVARLRTPSRWQGPYAGGPPPLARLADRLQVEPGERRERFLEQQRELFETTRRHLQRQRTLRSELRDELAARSPDRARIEALIEELGESYASLERALAQTVLASREILTPEQQERYFALLERLRAERRSGRGPGPPPGRHPRPRG